MPGRANEYRSLSTIQIKMRMGREAHTKAHHLIRPSPAPADYSCLRRFFLFERVASSSSSIALRSRSSSSTERFAAYESLKSCRFVQHLILSVHQTTLPTERSCSPRQT